MRIDIRKGFFCRCFFVACIIGIPLPIIGIVMLICKSDTIVFFGTLIIYAAGLAISSFVFAIYIYKKFEYHYIFLDVDYFSLVNRKGAFIDFENLKLFITNPMLGIIGSIIGLFGVFINPVNASLAYDFVVKDKKIEYTKVYLTIRQYYKIKKKMYEYVEIV